MTRTTRSLLARAGAIALAAFPLASPGQEPDANLPPSIRVNGEAVVTAKPDRVELDVGVVTQASQSEAAARENARQLEAALEALRRELGANADIRTISYSLQPNYQYPANGVGQPLVTGYTAMNVVRVTLDDLAKIGRVIDAATRAGANQVQRIRFTLKDETEARSRALREAAAAARAQAEALAAALGLKIVRVLSAVESSPVVYPMHDVMVARAEAATSPTPIQAGAIEIRASVALTVEVAER